MGYKDTHHSSGPGEASSRVCSGKMNAMPLGIGGGQGISLKASSSLSSALPEIATPTLPLTHLLASLMSLLPHRPIHLGKERDGLEMSLLDDQVLINLFILHLDFSGILEVCIDRCALRRKRTDFYVYV